MNCLTVKQGVECLFMSKKGCDFNGGTCHEILDDCQGCDRAKEFETGTFCISVPDPAVKWRRGSCNLATHLKAVAKEKGPKLNPLKASKRAAR
ncbi:MAG: PxxKW family cysteine-rich protein [Deltaproteobacteria bacterium]|nr:PxxKW family cysteine-rich protein [Deltaproteobacteria bacterium]